MSGKLDRKFEDFSVDAPAIRLVVAAALERQKTRLRLREIIEEFGPALKDLVMRPGEIECMVKDYKDALEKEGIPGAAEQAVELRTMLAGVRRRIEEGTFRLARKTTPKVAIDDEQPQSNSEIIEQLDEAAKTERVEVVPNGAEEGGQHSAGIENSQDVSPQVRIAAQHTLSQTRFASVTDSSDVLRKNKLPIVSREPTDGDVGSGDTLNRFDDPGEPEDDEALSHEREEIISRGIGLAGEERRNVE